MSYGEFDEEIEMIFFFFWRKVDVGKKLLDSPFWRVIFDNTDFIHIFWNSGVKKLLVSAFFLLSKFVRFLCVFPNLFKQNINFIKVS